MERMAKTKSIDRKKNRSKFKSLNLKLKNNFTAKNAERERSRVKSLRNAFQCLQSCLPSVPPNTKLSKLDVLILAANYISHLTKLVSGDSDNQINSSTKFDCDLKFLHPIKKWPMRSRLYSRSESVNKNIISIQEPITTIQSYYEFDQVHFMNWHN